MRRRIVVVVVELGIVAAVAAAVHGIVVETEFSVLNRQLAELVELVWQLTGTNGRLVMGHNLADVRALEVELE